MRLSLLADHHGALRREVIDEIDFPTCFDIRQKLGVQPGSVYAGGATSGLSKYMKLEASRNEQWPLKSPFQPLFDLRHSL